MAIVFQTFLSGLSLECDPSSKSALPAKLDVKFNFAGFKKLIAESVPVISLTRSTSSASSQVSFKFSYSTIYPHHLNSKIVKIKVYSKNVLFRTLVATGQFDLYTLATGPSSYRMTLDTVGKRRLILSFNCSFVQQCPNIVVTVGATDSAVTLLSSIPVEGKGGEFKLSGLVTDLEKCMIRVATLATGVRSYPLLASYDQSKMDIPQSIGSPKLKMKLRISQGPLYHQMSSESLADETGVVRGRIVPGYPTPTRWSASATLIGTWLPCQQDSRCSTQVTHVIELIHHHYSRLILSRAESVSGITEEEARKIKSNLCRAIARAKLRLTPSVE
jgi:hypothetical protein